MGDSCPFCEKFRRAGLERCPKCGRSLGSAQASTLVLYDQSSGQRWSLGHGNLIVGRKDAADRMSLGPDDAPLLLDDGFVSHMHAIIRASGSGFEVFDTDSRDGTHVNDRPISGPTQIANGDRLRFGDTVLVAELDGAAPALAAERLEETLQPEPSPPPPFLRDHAPPVEDKDRTMLEPSPGVRTPVRPLVPRAESKPVQKVGAKPASPREAVRPAPITADRVVRTSAPTPPPPSSEPEKPAVAPAGAAGPGRATTALRLPQLIRAANGLAASMRQFDQELTAALDTFEREGGRVALQDILAQARRVQANARAEDVEAMLAWLPQACRLLETELDLVNLLSARASDAPR